MLESQTVRCPWCGERFEASLDASEGDADYTEDCPVCCRPIAVHVSVDSDDQARAWVERE